MSIKTSITNRIISGVIGGVAKDPNIQATAAGSALAALIAANVDYGKLLFAPHDWAQLGILAAAVLVWALGFVANKNTVAKEVVHGLLERVAELEKK